MVEGSKIESRSSRLDARRLLVYIRDQDRIRSPAHQGVGCLQRWLVFLDILALDISLDALEV